MHRLNHRERNFRQVKVAAIVWLVLMIVAACVVALMIAGLAVAAVVL